MRTQRGRGKVFGVWGCEWAHDFLYHFVNIPFLHLKKGFLGYCRLNLVSSIITSRNGYFINILLVNVAYFSIELWKEAYHWWLTVQFSNARNSLNGPHVGLSWIVLQFARDWGKMELLNVWIYEHFFFTEVCAESNFPDLLCFHI